MSLNPLVQNPVGGGGGAITGYTQTATITTSGATAVPAGTKRIEALVCGGGGGGGTGTGGGGGFGGAQIYEIPVVGSSIDVVIGTGGTAGARGGTTTVSIGSTLYAAVGGGGASAGAGLYGGSGCGGNTVGGNGGAPFKSEGLLWSAMDVATRSGLAPYSAYTSNTTTLLSGFGTGYQTGLIPADGYLGFGGGGGGATTVGGTGGGGYGAGSGTAGAGQTGGGGGSTGSGTGGAGGTLASISVWGLTGFAGGTAGGAAGGGGGGLFGAGANGVTTVGGTGGLGGGGGGGGTTPGAGGAGAVVFRFYS